jgi:hypothetical protein
MFVITLWCNWTFAYAQKENYVWVFGDSIGLDFNQPAGNLPVTYKTNISAYAASASICDKNGKLLFYSNGNAVWDATNNVMPNGDGLIGDKYACSGYVAILPFVNDSTKFYLFYRWAYGSSPALYYSVIDITLNRGLGDIEVGRRNILLDTGITAAITTIRGSNCNYWLVTHRMNSTEFRCFNIDNNELHTIPVSSFVGSAYDIQMQGFEYSYDTKNKRLACGSVSSSAGLELYDFDENKGTVSNPQTITNNIDWEYHFPFICFSPDGTKLYASSKTSVYQYDLNFLPSVSAVGSSKTLLRFRGSTHVCEGKMRVGPDGKLYMGTEISYQYIQYVEKPNVSGTACNYVMQGVPYTTAKEMMRASLGNNVPAVCHNGFPSDINEAHLEHDITIMPNPVSNNGFIVKSVLSGNADLSISDITGKLVYSGQAILNKELILPYELKTGYYIVSVKIKDKLFNKRLLIQ